MDTDERISLHGKDPEEVLRALLKVDPEAEPATATVYVALAGEGVDVLRLVDAQPSSSL